MIKETSNFKVCQEDIQLFDCSDNRRREVRSARNTAQHTPRERDLLSFLGAVPPSPLRFLRRRLAQARAKVAAISVFGLDRRLDSAG